jgi:hypothetical protein
MEEGVAVVMDLNVGDCQSDQVSMMQCSAREEEIKEGAAVTKIDDDVVG